MELMDRCLDQLYKLVYEKLRLTIPEAVVCKMAESVSSPSLSFPLPLSLSVLPSGNNIGDFLITDNKGSPLPKVYSQRSPQR